jgi:hypothetical protein
VVTLTGTLTGSVPLCLQIDNVAGGTARGQATFKESIDNCSTFFVTGVLTAATVAATGPATGITINFPTGMYGTDQAWKATVAVWSDYSGKTLVQATPANQPLLVGSAKNGMPAVRGDGINDRLTATGLAGLAQPEDVFLPAIWTSTFSTTDSLFDGPSTNRMRLFRNADTSLTIFAGASLNASAFSSVLSWHTYRLSFNGAVNSKLWQDNVLQGTGNAGTGDALGFTLFDLGGGAQNTGATVPEVLIVSGGILGTTDAGLIQSYEKSRYGL